MSAVVSVPVPQPILQNQVEVTQGMSIAPALEISAQLVPFQTALQELEAQGTRVVIDSHDAFQRGTEFLSLCKQYSTQLESFRVTVKKPIDDYGKFIQALFKPMIDRFGVLSGNVSRLMLTFQQQERQREEDERQAASKRQEEEALRLASEREAQGDAAGAAAIVEAATTAPAPLPPRRMAPTNSFGHRTQTAKRWVGSVVEPMTVLKAILEGKVGIDIIDWRQVELNAIAKKIGVAGVHHGIKCEQSESLGLR